MSDIRVNTAKVRGTGDDMKALSGDTQRRMRNALDSSQAVADSHFGWQSAEALGTCHKTWEDRMVELAKKMGDLGQRLQDSADGYDAADQEAVSRLRAAMKDLGKH